MKALQVHAFDAPIQMTTWIFLNHHRANTDKNRGLRFEFCGFADAKRHLSGHAKAAIHPRHGSGGIVDAIGPDTDAPAVGSRVAVFGAKADWPNLDVLTLIA